MAMATQKSKQVKGTLPCGNPQRFDSTDVIKMSHKRKVLEVGQLETESEKHIKMMVQNQMKVDTTIEEQFSHHRSFTSASVFDPTADKLVGLHGYDQHKQVNELDSKVEYYRQCGLSEDEIVLMMKKESWELSSSKSKGTYGPDPIMEQRWLQEIEKKIKWKEEELNKPDSFKGGLELSRQSLDLEKSIAEQQNKVVILPPAILRQKKLLSSHPDDPVNHIDELMREIDRKTEREPRRDRRRRRKLHRQMLRQQLYMKDEDCESNKDVDNADDEVSDSSLSPSSSTSKVEDGIHVPYPTVPEKHQIPLPGSSQSTPFAPNKAVDASIDRNARDAQNRMKEITSNITPIPEEDVIANRLSVEEILAMEKFSNYQVGEQNKVIYVKNLPNNTKEEDLVALFGRYQTNNDEKIIFRLLSGRMKGQAFITFPEASTAGQAISLLNGYKLRDKPIIISYGKRKDDN